MIHKSILKIVARFFHSILFWVENSVSENCGFLPVEHIFFLFDLACILIIKTDEEKNQSAASSQF